MKQTYRSTTAFVFGWIWLAFVAFNVYDLTVRFNGKWTLVAGAVLAVLTAVVYLTSLRPATIITDEGLKARNPLRNVEAPWSALGEVSVGHSVSIEYGQGKLIRLWTPMASARERAKAQRRAMPRVERGKVRTEPVLSKGEQAAHDALAGKTHADWVGEQITQKVETARLRKEEPGQVRNAVAPDAVAVIALAVVMIVIAALA
ncbi:PH domain-containing protein [Nonomuraea sp. NPDC050663]|uniref:PH domain-containing protein n=1 Tax=Nonomuraea sp. NPDC050663 TaxID=3364370 RepID=UPI0037B9F9EA